MEKKSKIIFVTISMTGGGTERVIANLANHYVSIGHEVDILMIGGEEVAYKLDKSVKVRALSGSTGGSLSGRLNRIKAMRTAFGESKEMVIIAMGTVASMFTSLASLGLRNRLILSERNDPNQLNHRPIKGIERLARSFLYLRADKIVFQTPDAVNCFGPLIRKKAQIIMNPLEDAGGNPKSFPREHVVITAGRLTKQKNHKLLIDAFAMFVEEYPEYKLKIFGKGETKDELESYIKDKNLSERISLEGFSDNVRFEVDRSEIYVSSSDWEGISNSLMEAMASGISVIATDCPMGGSRMLIKDGINGRLVATQDVQGMAEAMKDLASSEDYRNKLGSEAIKIRDEASVRIIAKIWLE